MIILRRVLGLIIILTDLFGVALSVGLVLYGNQAIDNGASQIEKSLDLVGANNEDIQENHSTDNNEQSHNPQITLE